MRFHLYIFLFFCFGFLSAQKDSILDEKRRSYFQKGVTFKYKNIDSTHKYLMKSYNLADSLSDTNGKLIVLNNLIKSDSYHFDLKKLKKDIALMDSIINNDRYSDTLKYIGSYKKSLIGSKGIYYYKLKNFPLAKSYFDQLLIILDANKETRLSTFDVKTKISTLEYLAVIAGVEGKNDLAEQYYYNVLSILETKPFDSWQSNYFGAKYRFSRIYQNEKKYQKAKILQKESLTFYKTKSENSRFLNSLKSNYQALIKNYILQDSLGLALKYLDESSVFYDDKDPFLKNQHGLYGDVYAAKNNYKEALEYYNMAIEASKTYRNHQKHQDIAEAYARFGKLYSGQGDLDKSLVYYQEALMQLSAKFNNEDLNKNPHPKEVSSKLELIKILKQKLEVLYQAFKSKNDIEYLKIAITNSHDIVEVLDVLKPEFESKVDKQFLISEMYPSFHNMVEIAYDLYDQTNDKKYVEDAFHFMEKSKSILLLEATRNAQASSFGGISENVLSTEQQYRAKIIHLEKKLFSKGENKTISDSLFKIKNKYYNFISDIEQKHPRYYDLKYNDQVVSLSGAQNLLDQNIGLISYFATENNVFAITIQKNSSAFYKMPFDDQLRNEIRSFYTNASNLKPGSVTELQKTGNSIYENILDKPLMDLQAKTLIVLRDDVLNYIPFEALSKSPDQPKYLIQDYQISYAESATLLREQQIESDAKKHNLLAFAPSFGKANNDFQEERSDFGPLLYNTEEVKNIMNYFKGIAVTGNEASTEFFRNNSQEYNVLHFATHAAANDKNPDYSYLAFAEKDNGTPNLLYVKDLYAIDVDADLVTLSACQTGLGKLQRGEGMLSLARGFNYAGARSLVTTLWKVNDQTTAELMNNFYKNLSDNMPKDEALREAKLTYLNSTDDNLMKHPYYWSAFMISGDMTPIGNQTSKLWWLLMLIPVAIAVIRRMRNS